MIEIITYYYRFLFSTCLIFFGYQAISGKYLLNALEFKVFLTFLLTPIVARFLFYFMDSRINRDFLKTVTRLPLVLKPLKQSDKPVIILSAWAGARDKTLLKYAEMYQGLGYPSIRIGVNLTRLKGLNARV